MFNGNDSVAMRRELVRNPDARQTVGAFDPPSSDVTEFHRRLPGYRPTPLVPAPSLAERLGVGEVWVKDESSRLGLPAFKMLGASWAAYRALAEHLGTDLEPWADIDELAKKLTEHGPLALAAATDGNHGRAVARMAGLLGLEARIFVPAGTTDARIDAIRSEGASCQVVDGTYNDAVRRSAEEASDRCLVISDTSWPGYERIPGWVIDGYTTIYAEIEETLTAAGARPPDVVVVPVGVGAMACSAVRYYRQPDVTQPPSIVGVEPLRAACVLASARAGRIVSVPGPHDSIMAGLNCDTPSVIAWPVISQGIDLYIAIDDERAVEGMRQLADIGLVSGETGAAGLGALNEIISGSDATELRSYLGLGPESIVLLISTEGATDPDAYQRLVGRTPEDVAG